MPIFSADDETAALVPWSITIGGRTHTARQISRRAVLAFWAVVERKGPPTEQEVALEQLLRVAFPFRLSYRWRGDPVRQILALDPRVRVRALDSFFASLTTDAPSRPQGMSGKPGASPSSAVPSASPPGP